MEQYGQIIETTDINEVRKKEMTQVADCLFVCPVTFLKKLHYFATDFKYRDIFKVKLPQV